MADFNIRLWTWTILNRNQNHPEGLLKAEFTGLHPEFFVQWKGSHEFVVLTKFQVMLMLLVQGSGVIAFDKCSLHKWETLLKNFNIHEAFPPVCNLQKLEFWAKEKNPDLSLLSLFYKVKDPGQPETDLYLFKPDYFQQYLPVILISYSEWLLLSGISKCIILKNGLILFWLLKFYTFGRIMVSF